MHRSTVQRIKIVRRLLAERYEPGRQDRCKEWVFRTAVEPLLGISRRTFWRYLRISDAAPGSRPDERQLSLPL